MSDIMTENIQIYKISVNIPEEYANELMDSINNIMDPIYPGYERAFTTFHVKGTWKTLDGSHPYNGKTGEITIADELRIEFATYDRDLESVIKKIIEIHPYEEPGIDVIPMIGWKDFIRP